ncbi:glutathione peroxidase [Skermanella rosea]|uniref:glutathione peroxidase n=1 Tax=Skermanella rosea TaxID=1817965 RepID=UPI001932F720|nr:glutathione peroxidase [Skermanella rosea]UEM02758.1 glutathione peroxidase [Skermanella rosea]
MRRSACAAMLMLLSLVFALPPATAIAAMPTPGSAHDFDFVSIDGRPLPLKEFAGKAVLVVNTASMCGYTPQYADLQALWERYRGRGLVVLGVPSNDFGGQEPGSAEQIKDFCEVNFSVDFPMTEKQAVTGAGAHPFYRWAGQELGPAAAPRWNFHKYLVAPDGRLAGWFPTSTSPRSDKVVQAVEAVLPE